MVYKVTRSESNKARTSLQHAPARHGEANVVMQNMESYAQTQQTLALLKILALGNRQIEAGKARPATDALRRLRESRGSR